MVGVAVEPETLPEFMTRAVAEPETVAQFTAGVLAEPETRRHSRCQYGPSQSLRIMVWVVGKPETVDEFMVMGSQSLRLS